MKDIRGKGGKACAHCGICQKNCLFLQKYGITIGDMEEHEELLYHCFLCGRCTAACPEGIDGRAHILHLRQRQVEENGGAIKEDGYDMLIREKQDYLYASYRNQTAGSVLFPGCSFPGFYPKTTEHIIKLFKEKAGIGTVFDCCGKPVAELGLADAEEKIVERLNRRFAEGGVEEVIMLCPNCYHFLKPRLKVKIVSIYDKLKALGIGCKIREKVTLFPPCPDRESQEMLQGIRRFLSEDPYLIENVQCCGLGGCAGAKEKELAQQLVDKAQEHGAGICTYCASCSGNFARKGYAGSEHLLLKILQQTESPDVKETGANRAKMKEYLYPSGKVYKK